MNVSRASAKAGEGRDMPTLRGQTMTRQKIKDALGVSDTQAETIEEWIDDAYKTGNSDGSKEAEMRRGINL